MQVHPNIQAHPSSVDALQGIKGAKYDATSIREPSNVAFDPKKHLAYVPPSKKYTMEELGYPGIGISKIATTEPFQLFTPAAVLELRKDALSTKAHDHFQHTHSLSAYQVREYHPKIAPFVCQAFSSPEFVRACSDAAGVELVPIMPLEYGHTNFQVGPDGHAGVRALGVEPSAPMPPSKAPEDQSGENCVHEHCDAYPFVAVTMLSNCETMIGGETAIKKGDGTYAKIRGPDMGFTVMLQGRYLPHIAMRAFNSKERITMVTSFRAKDAMMVDDSNLTNIRNFSRRNRLNAQWSIYRLKLVAERMNIVAKKIEDESKDDVYAEKDVWNKQTMQAFVDEQMKYLNYGISEMMD